MSRVLVTGSADGLGLLAARLLIAGGHDVVLHARNAGRADDALAAAPGAAGVLTGDLSSVAEVEGLAERANATGRFDAIIHNAGVGYREPRPIRTAEGLPHVFAINVLAPYLLTALITRPDRLVYLGSGMHRGGDPGLDDLRWERRRWNGSQAYADSKLFDVVLAFAVARRWPEVSSNAVDPGWVATKMGGSGAPDDIDKGAETQAWLAVSDDTDARVGGGYFFHRRPREVHPAARDESAQDGLLDACAEITGVSLP
jgi:NAD(P)-dependent dehydrogenase (short-subunit alcohol dehydrogenase family)